MLIRLIENLVAWTIILGFALWLLASWTLEKAERVINEIT